MKERDPRAARAFEKAESAGQGHVLRFWGDLGPGEREQLLSDIERTDFSVTARFKPLLERDREPFRHAEVPEVIPVPRSERDRLRMEEAREAGEELIGASKTALFTAAGGQSSRLGIEAPKGVYPVTPVRRKSLFRVFAETVRHLQDRYAVTLPWVLMVSDTNRDETVRYFTANRFFGLDPGNVRFIEQGMFPAVSEEGGVLLAEKHRVFLSPSGHGGTFSALKNSGALEWLDGRGVEELFYFQVDNVLAKVLDPVFVGYHALGRCQMSSKSVRKKEPGEKLGVFAVLDGKVSVVEYSELGLIESVLGKGSSDLFTAGSIAIHMLNLRFCAAQSEEVNSLPLHLAHKTMAHLDQSGGRVDPAGPNGYKFETFIFDALRNVENTVIMEVDRGEEFSPLKNRSGEDSPDTVRRDQVLLFSRWLERAGMSVPRDRMGAPLHGIEVSPLFALSAEEFQARASASGVDRTVDLEGDIYIE